MERKFLKDLGVADEAIDKIMAEYGKDVEKVKGERDDYKQKYEDTQKALKAFDGIDVKDLQNKVKQLTEDLDKKDKEYAAQLDERDFHATVKSIAASLKARNHNAVLAVLGQEKVDALKASKNREKDIEAAFKALKEDKESAYLFDVERAPRIVGPTSGPAKDTDDTKSKANEALRGLFGKGEGE